MRLRDDVPIGVALDEAVEQGRMTPHDAEQVETFHDFLRYAGKPGKGNRAQLRWLAAFVRTDAGCRFFLGTPRDAASEAYAVRLVRLSWRHPYPAGGDGHGQQ